MSGASILHVGEDTCRRIPVLEHAGYRVLQTGCSLSDVAEVLKVHGDLRAALFQTEPRQKVARIASKVRECISGPLILFEDSGSRVDEEPFDLVIPPLTAPDKWLRVLRTSIEKSRELQAVSEKLREEAANAQAASRNIRASVARTSKRIDADAPWRALDGSPADD